MRNLILTFIAIIPAVLCCHSAEAPPPAKAEGAEFHAALLEIAASYPRFRRLNETSRWAPLLCGPPPAPVSAAFSLSKDKDTHGQKLYFLFAKDRLAYLSLGAEKVPAAEGYKPAPELKAVQTQQIVVKEAWLPKEVDDKDPVQIAPRSGRGGFSPYASKDGKTYHASEKAALFVMMQLDAKTPNTDEGWVYGTLSPDGKTVTSAGRVSSCMECHQSAPHGRLFGLPKEKKKPPCERG